MDTNMDVAPLATMSAAPLLITPFEIKFPSEVKTDEVKKLTKPKISKPVRYEIKLVDLVGPTVAKYLDIGKILKNHPGYYELETRLIIKPTKNDEANPYILEKDFNDILNYMLQHTEKWKRKSWYVTRDRYYKGETIGDYYKGDIRERTEYPNPQKLGEKDGETTWVRKELIRNIDIPVYQRSQAIRVSFKSENDSKPIASKPYRHQQKQVCSLTDGAVTIYFAHVLSGETERELREAKPKQTIEVEVNGSYIRNPLVTPTDILTILLVRTLTLLGDNKPMSLGEY